MAYPAVTDLHLAGTSVLLCARAEGQSVCTARRAARAEKCLSCRAYWLHEPVRTHRAQNRYQRIELSLQQVKGIDQVSLSEGCVCQGLYSWREPGTSHRLSDNSAPQSFCDLLCIAHESLAGPERLLEVFRQDASEVGHIPKDVKARSETRESIIAARCETLLDSREL